MLTPDKDLGQAIRGQRVVMVDRIRRRVIDEEELLRLRGVRPSSVPDWLGLVGDTADGIPGIEGFGEKTAAALLRAFGRIDDIPNEARKWPPEIRGADRLAARLAAERETALLYRRLATLLVDVPLAEHLEELAWKGTPQAFAAWCDAAGAESWKTRPRRSAA
jgi:5'-3' exonuclease